MSDKNSNELKQSIRNFEQKTMNRSMTDLLVFDWLADYLLECCSAEAKANTLSLFSLLPLLLTSFFITGPSRFWFLIAGISILLHQILDIANKKQAYRLSTFSFGTYYFDHMCDSVSCMSIVYIIGTLFELSNSWLWLCIFCFGMLPFYVHHLAMYYSEYMFFPLISPASEGLLILELVCLLGIINPTLYSIQLGTMVLSHILIALASLWLAIFLVVDIRQIRINSQKFNEQISLKNTFVILVLGYVMLEASLIQPDILNQSPITFALFYYSMVLCFTILIGELVLAYGTGQKFMQISVNTLIVTAIMAAQYAICAFIPMGSPTLKVVGVASGALLAAIQTVYYAVRGRQIMSLINDAINNE